MSIIIHALTPTELAALAPTESSCTHLNTLRLGFGGTGPGGCCCWGYGCHAARPAKQVKDSANVFLNSPKACPLTGSNSVTPQTMAVCTGIYSLVFLGFDSTEEDSCCLSLFFSAALFSLGPIRKLTFLHLSQSLFYVEIFQNSRSSCSAPCN